VIATELARFTHDGFADMLYVFFPLWQTQFGLAFDQIGLFKMFFSGTLAFFHVPFSSLTNRLVPVRFIWAGTLVTSLPMSLCSRAASPGCSQSARG
jgi:MFS transporter, FSR family, fosmidomycin resistance protein